MSDHEAGRVYVWNGGEAVPVPHPSEAEYAALRRLDERVTALEAELRGVRAGLADLIERCDALLRELRGEAKDTTER